jgi:hypothetical protein
MRRIALCDLRPEADRESPPPSHMLTAFTEE